MFGCATLIAGDGHAKRGGKCGASVACAESIVFALGTREEATIALACANVVETFVVASGQ